MSHASCYYRSLVTSPGGTWQLLYTCHSKHVISYKLWVPGCVTVHALAIKTDVKPTRVIITTMIMYNNRSVSRRQHQEGCIRSHFRDQLFVVMPVLLLPLMHTRRQPGPRPYFSPRPKCKEDRIFPMNPCRHLRISLDSCMLQVGEKKRPADDLGRNTSAVVLCINVY